MFSRKNIDDCDINDMDLPSAPKLEILKETFNGLENITEEWYKNNRD